MGQGLAVRREGSGPALLLVHGGVGPEVGWELQEPLAGHYSLIVPWRYGYGDSPPAEQQDFDADADALLALLADEPAHAAAFSYGALGLLVAASRSPRVFRSLTLIEPPLFSLAGDDAAVQELLGEIAQMSQPGAEGPPEQLRGFLMLQALSAERGYPPPPPMRPPHEAEIDYAGIVSAHVPALVVSGDHHPGFESTCDALAEALEADRAVLPGAGHAPQRAAGFNERLVAFLQGVESII